MVTVDFKESFWKGIDGTKSIERLTLTLDGKDAYTFDKHAISTYAARGDGSLNTIKLHLMGAFLQLKLSEEDKTMVAKEVLKKLQSYGV